MQMSSIVPFNVIYLLLREDVKYYFADFVHYEGSTSVMNFGTNPQHDFPKMRGGGAKGRSELFRKFIRFGEGMPPL